MIALTSLAQLTARIGVAITICLPLATASPEDRILLKDGSVLVVDAVVADGFDKVEFKKGAAIGSQPSSKVKAIEYGDAPGFLRLSRERRAARDFKNATNLMKAALAAPGVRAWIQTDGQLELAETLRQWAGRDRSKYAAAIEAYDSALADTRSRSRPDALIGRALAHAGAGDLDSALGDLATLKHEATTNGYGITTELRADYERTSLLIEAGRPEMRQAIYELEALATRYASNQELDDATKRYALEVTGLVRLAKGRLLIADGRSEQAASSFAAVLADAKESTAVRGAAQVGLGLALRAQGKRKEAQFEFARARIRFANEREAACEATYWLAIVCEELGSAEPRGDALAQEYFAECALRYDGTRYAEKARAKLR